MYCMSNSVILDIFGNNIDCKSELYYKVCRGVQVSVFEYFLVIPSLLKCV